MRLGGHILRELLLGGGLLAGSIVGVGLGVVHGSRIVHSWGEWAQTRAYASQVPGVPPGAVTAAAVAAALVPLERPGRLDAPEASSTFLGVKDESLLLPLRIGSIKRAKFNKGGSSISLRIEFESGARAAFKPDQTNYQTIPRKEIAAFRLSRLLGLGAVAPAIGRRISRDELVARLDPEARALVPRFLAEVPADPDGTVSGELSYWIPEIVNAAIGGVPIDGVPGMNLWKRYLTVGEAVPPEARLLVPQISDMVAFDFLTGNVDRWSGSNVKASPDGRTLYFMDNALSFGPEAEGHSKVQFALSRVQKFSRRLYRAVKTLDARDVRAAMRADASPYIELLSESEIAAVMARRDRLVRHVDELVRAHGESAVLVFD